jgi:hypothetical protein
VREKPGGCAMCGSVADGDEAADPCAGARSFSRCRILCGSSESSGLCDSSSRCVAGPMVLPTSRRCPWYFVYDPLQFGGLYSIGYISDQFAKVFTTGHESVQSYPMEVRRLSLKTQVGVAACVKDSAKANKTSCNKDTMYENNMLLS